MAEPIEQPFRMTTGVGPSNRALDGRAYYAIMHIMRSIRHLVNTVEQLCVAFMSGSASGVGHAACFLLMA